MFPFFTDSSVFFHRYFQLFFHPRWFEMVSDISSWSVFFQQRYSITIFRCVVIVSCLNYYQFFYRLIRNNCINVNNFTGLIVVAFFIHAILLKTIFLGIGLTILGPESRGKRNFSLFSLIRT